MTNTEIIEKFYTCFRNQDYKGMQELYGDDAVFSDPVFGKLTAAEVRAMWEMLITRATDLRITSSNISASADEGSAEWIAYYTFTSTGEKVVNRIKARFQFREGKIVQHDDWFSFYNWSKQSLGFKGLLLGWSGFLKNKVSEQALKNLRAFMKHKN